MLPCSVVLVRRAPAEAAGSVAHGSQQHPEVSSYPPPTPPCTLPCRFCRGALLPPAELVASPGQAPAVLSASPSSALLLVCATDRSTPWPEACPSTHLGQFLSEVPPLRRLPMNSFPWHPRGQIFSKLQEDRFLASFTSTAIQ